MGHKALTPLFNEIVDAIHEKDGLSDGIAAKDFPARIREIPAGSSAARPDGWLELPEPVDDEMYLLAHIPDGGGEQIKFTVACTGKYTVELGTVKYQLFVPANSQTVQSGTAYEATLAAEDYGDALGNGTRQAVVRISGTGIKTWVPSMNQNIVDIKCRLPNGTSVMCGNENHDLALANLKFFTWRGLNSMVSMANMFRNCAKLIKIFELNSARVTNMSFSFAQCTSLPAVPAMDTSSAQILNSTFSGCTSIVSIPEFDTSNVTYMGSAFEGCSNLASVHGLNIEKASYMGAIFSGCSNLRKIRLGQSTSECPGCDFSIANCGLDHTALVEFFESLPLITEIHTLTIKNNPGVLSLSDMDKNIATEKNWMLAL